MFGGQKKGRGDDGGSGGDVEGGVGVAACADNITLRRSA